LGEVGGRKQSKDMAGKMYFKWRSGLEFYQQKNKEIKTSKIEFVKI